MKGQTFGTYWYNDGVPGSVYYQTDVFSFKCFGGVPYTGIYDTSIVDTIIFRGARRDKSNDVFFKSSSTLAQRLNEAQFIHNSGQVQYVYLNVSRDPNAAYSSNKWLTIDNLILVNFKDPYPSQSFLSSFMAQYELTPHYEPIQSLPITTGCSYTYIFEAHIPENDQGILDYEYFVELMRNIFTNSGNDVCEVGPNFVNHNPRVEDFNPGNPPVPPAAPVYPICGSGSPNDTWADYQWYIKNDGFNETDFPGVSCFPDPNPTDGMVGADAKICGCWNAGLTGQGVKVGIIARGDIHTSHNEFTTQSFATKWDCSVGGPNCIPLTPASAPFYQTGVGMHMTGIIGAKKDNNAGIAGIAENCEIIPYKIGDDFSSDASLTKAIHQALVDRVDVLAIEYFSPIATPNAKIELWKHHNLGRDYVPGHNPPLGTIIIAPAGHTESALMGNNGLTPMYPAKYNLNAFDEEPEVIGVINSNRYDKLETGENTPCYPNYSLGSPSYAYPSNYGQTYDVAAPSSNFFSTEGQGIYRGVTGFTSEVKQSASAVAITAGVAALLLESNKFQTDVQFRDRLRSTSDKVGGYTYYTNPNGIYSIEMAFGRINCLSAKDAWSTSTQEVIGNSNDIKWIDNATSWILLGLDKNKSYQWTLTNSIGQVVQKGDCFKMAQPLSIEHASLAAGVYFFTIQSSVKEVSSLKLVK